MGLGGRRAARGPARPHMETRAAGLTRAAEHLLCERSSLKEAASRTCSNRLADPLPASRYPKSVTDSKHRLLDTRVTQLNVMLHD